MTTTADVHDVGPSPGGRLPCRVRPPCRASDGEQGAGTVVFEAGRVDTSGMRSNRVIALGVLVLATAACTPGADRIPPCDGQLQASITNAAGSASGTREEAAIGALETVFDIDVDRVVLIPAEHGRFRVVVVDMTVLDRPPVVSVHRSGSGSQSEGLVC